MEVTQLLTISQFARVTGLNYWLARQLVKRGKIPSVLVGNRRRIDARWMHQWLASGGYRGAEANPRNEILGVQNR
jgi:excisionase family DNA binding protein